MSYNPSPVAQVVRTSKTLGAFATRVQLARLSPTTFTTAAFTVPAVQATVAIPVVSGSSFLAGDWIKVGTRACVLKAPVHATTGPGSLAFSGHMPGSLSPGNNVSPVGHRMISTDNPSARTTDTTSASWTIPNYQQASAVSISVADRGQIPSGGPVTVTNYAGLFQVVSSTATTITARLITEGDLLAGETCVRETSYTYTGAPVAQGYPLQQLEPVPYRAFFPIDAFAVSVSSTSPSATTAAISIGYSAGADTGRARYGDWAQGLAVQSGTVLSVGTVVPLETNLAVQSDQRLAVPWGHALFAAVTTASGTFPTTDATIDLLVRGYYSQG